DALQLAAEGGQVQVGLEHLVLGEAALDGARRAHLPPLVGDVAATGRGEARIDQRGELHGDGARAATALDDARPGGEGDRGRAPVDTAMLREAPILGSDNGGDQRRRYAIDADPVQPPAMAVDAQLMQQFAVSVEQPRVARRVGAANALGVVADLAAVEVPGGAQPRRREGGECGADTALASHRPMTTGSLGATPCTSGAYMASTLVGAMANVPAVFRRTRYSRRQRPRGMKS